MRQFTIWAVCGASLIAAFVIDWRAAGLMFIAAWMNNLLGARRGDDL